MNRKIKKNRSPEECDSVLHTSIEDGLNGLNHIRQLDIKQSYVTDWYRNY
jgi:hypothetical protein